MDGNNANASLPLGRGPEVIASKHIQINQATGGILMNLQTISYNERHGIRPLCTAVIG